MRVRALTTAQIRFMQNQPILNNSQKLNAGLFEEALINSFKAEHYFP